jgi:hypothetical protein
MHTIIQNMETLRIMNLLLESEGAIELACHVICTSSDKLNEYQKERIMSVLKDDDERHEPRSIELACHVICTSSDKLNEYQKERMMSVLKDDDERHEPQSPPSPFLWAQAPHDSYPESMDLLMPEVKPDTLLENSCGICGASYVDHGELACNDYGCLYNVRNGFGEGEDYEDDHEAVHEDAEADEDADAEDAHAEDAAEDADADAETEEESSPSGASPAALPVDNWVQCDCCDTWRKVASLENITNEWFCSDIKKACRAPSEAENHWPATRAKYAVRFCDTGYGYYKGYEHKTYEGNRVPSHMECLKILAERKKITLEELYTTRPENYFGKEYDNFIRVMHGNTRSAYNYFWR